MKQKKLCKIILIVIFSCSIGVLLGQDTIIDTVYSYANIDGGIGYNTWWHTYAVDTTYGACSVGDGYDMIEGGVCYDRMFLSFAKPEIPEDYALSSAVLHIYQQGACGNDTTGNYPEFNFDGYEVEPQCLIEHVNYGYSLDIGDFDTVALATALVLSTTPDQDWRILDITDWVIDDLDEAFHYTQSRIRLEYNMDNDYLSDFLYFKLGVSWQEPPFIEYTIEPESSVEDDYTNETNLKVIISPNPIRSSGKVQFSINQQSDLEIEIYNIKGQLMKKIKSKKINRGENEIIFDCNGISSGIYFLKCTQNQVSQITKFVVTK